MNGNTMEEDNCLGFSDIEESSSDETKNDDGIMRRELLRKIAIE